MLQDQLYQRGQAIMFLEKYHMAQLLIAYTLLQYFRCNIEEVALD